MVKGAKDEDGKGDSTIFGNAEAVDAILMEMEDIHEWNEEATEAIIKRLSSHLVPDFFTLGKKTPGATIDEIRAVQSWLEDGTEEKVVIFENVEDYTEGAKNSMLKMLEEPPSHSHIILISEYPSRLLETILSRVRRFSFPELSGAAISSFLCEKLMVFGDYPSFDAFYFDMTESDEDKHSVREAAVRYTEALLSGEMLSLEDESGIFQLLEKLSALQEELGGYETAGEDYQRLKQKKNDIESRLCAVSQQQERMGSLAMAMGSQTHTRSSKVLMAATILTVSMGTGEPSAQRRKRPEQETAESFFISFSFFCSQAQHTQHAMK